jgi:hypothetical protein
MVFIDVTLRILVDDGEEGLRKAQEIRQAAIEKLKQDARLVCISLHDGENPIEPPQLISE